MGQRATPTRHLTAIGAMVLVAASASPAHADDTEQERLAAEEATEALQERSEPTTPRRSVGTMTFGIVLTGAGGVTALAGLVLAVSNPTKHAAPSYEDGQGVPIGMLVGGGVFALLGVPLIVYGAQRTHTRSAQAFAPTVAVGPGSVRAEVWF